MHQYRTVLIVLLVYLLCYTGLYPLYKYLFASDGIGYLAVTRHLAAGDYVNGINGYWSPLHSWLGVPFYKAGMNEFIVFRLLNVLFGAGILIAVHALLNKLTITGTLKTITLCICIPIVLCYAFDFGVDELLCLMLLIYANVIIQKDLFTKPGKNVLCGIIGCISYFAKTYAFVFFIIHFIIVQYILYKRSGAKNRTSLLFRNLLLGLGSFIVLAAPWIYLLSSRYHFLTFGYSGSLNYRVVMASSQTMPPELIAVPPQGLSCFWENTWFYPQKQLVTVSLHTVLLQLKVILHNVIIAIQCFTDISLLSLAVTLALGLYSLKKKDNALGLLFSLVVVLCAGYLPVHIETRFLWTATFLLLITGLMLFNQLLAQLATSKKITLLAWSIFFGSFLIQPIHLLQDWAGSGKDSFVLAQELKAKGVKGNFISSLAQYNTAEAIAYFTGNKYCSITRSEFTYDELLTACREKNIDYYFFFYNTPTEATNFKSTVLYQKAAGEIKTSYPNLILLKLKADF